ncbi:MAG: hypothetical protein WBP97_16970, partial [Candidatus Sulfotelmatobacter sp.]
MRGNARWELAADDPARVQILAASLRDLPFASQALNAPSVNGRSLNGRSSPSASALHRLAGLLLRRGLSDAESAARFLSPSLTHLHLPEQMTGLRGAVDRIDAAIERKESILIYGDYDVDGTMAVIILKTAIELCGGTADFH